MVYWKGYLTLFTLALCSFVNAGIKVFEWEMSYVTAAPNGVERLVIGVNGYFPPPTITVCKGDQVVIHVTNNLNDGEYIALHTHGIFQNGTNYYDGVDQVTQWYLSTPHNVGKLIRKAVFHQANHSTIISTLENKQGHTGFIRISKDNIQMGFGRPL